MAPPSAGHELQAAVEGGYYEVLGVPFEASDEEIRKRYHGIVRTLHPDRRRPGSSNGDALERFHQVQSAWRCLSDPTRRLLYDLRNFGKSSLAAEAGLEGRDASPTAEDELVRLQKEQALRDVDNMEVVLQKVLRRERAARGVVIRNALYGDLRLREESFSECFAGTRPIEPQDLVGPFVDVAVPLQCLVEQHTIVLPGGASASKADLPGFYNPLPLDLDVELSLYVLYEFRGNLHEVIIADRETLSLPYRKHVVPVGKAPRGPFSPANVALLRRGTSVGAGNSSRATAAGPSAVAAKSEAARGQRSTKTDAAEALHRAVALYSFHRLRARGPGEPTEREFLAVAIGVVTALAFAVGAAGKAVQQADNPQLLRGTLGTGAALALACLWKVSGGQCGQYS